MSKSDMKLCSLLVGLWTSTDVSELDLTVSLGVNNSVEQSFGKNILCTCTWRPVPRTLLQQTYVTLMGISTGALGTWQLTQAKQSHRTTTEHPGHSWNEWQLLRDADSWTISIRTHPMQLLSCGSRCVCKRTEKGVKWAWKNELSQREEMDLDQEQGHPHYLLTFGGFLFFCFLCLFCFLPVCVFKQKYYILSN